MIQFKTRAPGPPRNRNCWSRPSSPSQPAPQTGGTRSVSASALEVRRTAWYVIQDSDREKWSLLVNLFVRDFEKLGQKNVLKGLKERIGESLV